MPCLALAKAALLTRYQRIRMLPNVIWKCMEFKFSCCCSLKSPHCATVC